jgi:uncharacterized membrane protein YfcA
MLGWLGLGSRTISCLAFVVGIIGGIYGIVGGSILGLDPGRHRDGDKSRRPAALASTWVTSIIGVVAYAVIAFGAPGTIAPDWTLGIATGVGEPLVGYTGARLQPRLPDLMLRRLLGTLAVVLAAGYLMQALF